MGWRRALDSRNSDLNTRPHLLRFWFLGLFKFGRSGLSKQTGTVSRIHGSVNFHYAAHMFGVCVNTLNNSFCSFFFFFFFLGGGGGGNDLDFDF